MKQEKSIIKDCICKQDTIPEGASIEKYLCADCGGIAIGWYWSELGNV